MPKKKKLKLPKYVVIKSGQWHVKREYATNERWPDGRIKRKAVTHKCVPETAERAEEIARELDRQYNSKPQTDGQTVGQFILSVIAAKKPSIASRTHQDYLDLYERYVRDTAFNSVLFTNVTALTVQTFYGSLKASGTMIRKLNVMLSMCFNQGVKWDMLAKNPCKGVILPRLVKGHIEIMPEVKPFMSVCLSDPQFYVLAFALETGMRPEEYLSIAWKNIKGHTAKVERAVVWHKGGGFTYEDVKTKASRRTIELSDQICEMLDKQKLVIAVEIARIEKAIGEPLLLQKKGVAYRKRKARRDNAIAKLKAYRANDLVFPASNGGPMTLNNLGRREMKDACQLAGLPELSLYSLRHSMATTALANGADIKSISTKLGHASITITLDTYSHAIPVMRERSLAALAEALY